MSDEFKQLSMFGDVPELGPQPEEPGTAALLPDTPLKTAIEVYIDALKLAGSSFHTVKAFKSDLGLLARWAGPETPVSEFSTARLNKFLNWMLTERDKPCSPKTYARRVTTLKSFFGYLLEEHAVVENPASAVIQQPVTSPLPEALTDDEIKSILDVTGGTLAEGEKADPRPHLLVRLLLQTGIKKSECMALKPEDVLRDDSDGPILWVRYASPKMRYKERKIPLEKDWPALLDSYMSQYKPEKVIFDCTARNLEYVLDDVAKAAGVPRRRMSFETLRWTCALRDWRAGMDQEKLRQKLGLSRISWRETSSKLQQMAEQPDPPDAD